MIFGSQFYNQSLRKYIVAFGNMFNDMVVQRIDTSNTVIQTIAVPITYGPKEKFLARLSDPNLDRAIAVQLPAISFEISSMQYDGSRKLTSVTRNIFPTSTTDKNKIVSQWAPVPYNINFVLYMYVRNADDGAQLLEQILPYFGPEWTNTINLIPEMEITFDVPTILMDVMTEDAYEGDFITRRAMMFTLNFVMKGWFFGPTKTSGVIKRAQIDIGIVSGNTRLITAADITNTGRSSRIVITPGLLANGQPTTNSAASIAYTLISANSNYGLAANTFFYTDGKKYNPRTGTDYDIT